MLGDPATTADTDGSDLALIQPDPGEPVDALPSKSESLQHIDHHLLKLTQIPVQIRLMTTQIKHGIRNQLTWCVMGDLATAVDPVEGGRGTGWVEAEMGVRRAAAEGVAARMLKQPDRFRGSIA